MPRTAIDSNLQTRAARDRLANRQEPYWKAIGEGAHVGYYRGTRNGRWVARYRKPGSPAGYQKTTIGDADDHLDANGETVFSFAQAQERARAWFDVLTRGGRPPKKRTYTVGDALDHYLANFEGKSLLATANRINSILRPVFHAIPIGDLTSTEIAAWLKQRSVSPAKLRTSRFALTDNVRPPVDTDGLRRRRSTANRDYTVLKAALNRAFREGMVSSDEAWRRVRPFRNVDGANQRFLTDEETRSFIAAVPAAFQPVAQAATLTAARYGDIVRARVRDFDRSSCTWKLPDSKSGRPQIVYLEEEGTALFCAASLSKKPEDFLFLHPSGRQWGPSEQSRFIAAAWAQSEIPKATFHDLRRTYGARLARAGVPLSVISRALGHADERMTQKHYAHLAPSYVSETIRTHVRGLGIVISPSDGMEASSAAGRGHAKGAGD